MQRLLSLTVLLGALANLGFGLFALAQPHQAAELSSLDLTPDSARAEYRAVFGGLVASLGACMLLVLARRDRTGALLLALLFGGLVAGRIVDLAVATWDPMQLGLIGLELGMGASLVLWARGVSPRAS